MGSLVFNCSFHYPPQHSGIVPLSRIKQPHGRFGELCLFGMLNLSLLWPFLCSGSDSVPSLCLWVLWHLVKGQAQGTILACLRICDNHRLVTKMEFWLGIASWGKGETKEINSKVHPLQLSEVSLRPALINLRFHGIFAVSRLLFEGARLPWSHPRCRIT